VPDPRTPAAELTQPEIHHLGEPLTGALFDVFVEVFQADLVAAGLIGADLAALSYGSAGDPGQLEAVERGFAHAYRGRHAAFKTVLLGARDYLGALLAGAWTRLSPQFLRYADVGRAVLAADRALTGGRQQRVIRDSLAWREIGLPVASVGLRGLSYWERWRLAHEGIT
jgi:hypothetical protein